MSIAITIEVPNKKWAAAFWGWYLDGGGDDGFLQTLDDQHLCECGEGYSDWSVEDWTIRHSNQPLNTREAAETAGGD